VKVKIEIEAKLEACQYLNDKLMELIRRENKREGNERIEYEIIFKTHHRMSVGFKEN
jgi:hypothetical protein